MTVQTVTVMFTDLVASTELLVRVGQVEAERLRREFFEVVRSGAATHDGSEVKSMGDGFMFAFSSAASAIGSAIAVQQALTVRNLRATEPLSLRVGISVGDVESVDRDYFGIPVVEAARLCADADGGQILVSTGVVALARDRTDAEFVPLGPRHLKGLDRPVEVIEVAWSLPDPTEVAGRELPEGLLRAASRNLVGRSTERASLVASFDATATAGPARVVVIRGEPGVGKSTLAAHVAAQLCARGALVALGQCGEEAGAAYQPWREVLTRIVARMPDRDREAHLVANGDVLRTLVPELSDQPSGLGRSTDEDPESVRCALFAAVADALAQVSTIAPIVIVLDDLHWADASSLALFRHVAKSSKPMHVLIIVTCRDAEAAASDAVADALADLHRAQEVERIDLRGLDDHSVLELIGDMVGIGAPAAAETVRDALVAETDGNPFFVIELLRHLTDTGAIDGNHERGWSAATALESGGLPLSVREVIGRRVAHLGDGTQRVMASASVIGRVFDLDVLASVDRRGELDVLEDVESAVDAGLLNDLSNGAFSFSHALIQRTLYQEIKPTRRAFIHRRVAEEIESRVGTDMSEVAATLARHWCEVDLSDGSARAVGYSLQAGQRALGELAPEEAVRCFTMGLEVLERAPNADPRMRCRLLVGLGEAQWQTGNADHHLNLVDAAASARRLGDITLLCEAAIAGFGGPPSISLPPPERVEALEAAEAGTRDEVSTRRAEILTRLGAALSLVDTQRAQGCAIAAVEIARRLDDEHQIAWTLVRSAWPMNVPNNRATFDAMVDEALACSEDLADPILSWHTHLLASRRARSAGDVDGMVRHDTACSRIAAIVDQPILRSVTMQSMGVTAMIAGALEWAEELVTEAHRIGSEAGHPDALAIFVAQLGTLRLMQGEAGDIYDLLADMVEQHPNIPAYRAAAAACAVSLGLPEDAAATLEPDIRAGFSTFPLDGAWSTAMHFCAETVASLGLVEPAETLIEMIAPYQTIVPSSIPTCYEVFHHSLGELLSVVGRHDAAEQQLRLAEARHREMRAPFFLARTRLSLGEMLTRRGASDDVREARELFGQVARLADERNYPALRQRAERLLTALPAT